MIYEKYLGERYRDLPYFLNIKYTKTRIISDEIKKRNVKVIENG